eukprot:gb/GEZJ01005828.1/.p1 GENE.gb/GEZJ01005828.1/~~gb/GEZJ01005828.1/.p1  ORF type:complete len:136 (-),score=12.94 gb/GEZJ01005828.1/:312-719(-)
MKNCYHVGLPFVRYITLIVTIQVARYHNLSKDAKGTENTQTWLSLQHYFGGMAKALEGVYSQPKSATAVRNAQAKGGGRDGRGGRAQQKEQKKTDDACGKGLAIPSVKFGTHVASEKQWQPAIRNIDFFSCKSIK